MDGVILSSRHVLCTCDMPGKKKKKTEISMYCVVCRYLCKYKWVDAFTAQWYGSPKKRRRGKKGWCQYLVVQLWRIVSSDGRVTWKCLHHWQVPAWYCGWMKWKRKETNQKQNDHISVRYSRIPPFHCKCWFSVNIFLSSNIVRPQSLN